MKTSYGVACCWPDTYSKVMCVKALRDGIRKGDQAYAAFQGRRLGLAFMTEYLDPAARSSVPAFCRKHGIAMFRRNGCDIQVARPGMAPGRGLVRFV